MGGYLLHGKKDRIELGELALYIYADWRMQDCRIRHESSLGSISCRLLQRRLSVTNKQIPQDGDRVDRLAAIFNLPPSKTGSALHSMSFP